jgi:6-phosphogluconate dehydrogenase
MQAGLIGLGVMGRNLALNLHDKGHQVIATDSWESARAWSAAGIEVVGGHAELVARLDAPRVVLLMVKAGEQVDKEIATIIAHLVPGDTIIDLGNSYYRDTERRSAELAGRGFGYLGIGISGGAEGARHGAALMAGGGASDWARAKQLLSDVAAKAQDGTPTIDHFGPGGSGHFVKMVHNGIEYAIMQAIGEAHAVMRDVLGLGDEEIAEHITRWGTSGAGAGFLLEITAEIVQARDALTGAAMLPLIDDAAGQKGTGSWTAAAAVEHSVPATAIMEALAARQVSGQAAQRALARNGADSGAAQPRPIDDAGRLVGDLEAALTATMITALGQGVQIFAAASADNGWRKDVSSLLRVWRAGSILRMGILDSIADALDDAGDNDAGSDLFLVPQIVDRMLAARPAWRRAVSAAVLGGSPAPVVAAALNHVESLATEPLATQLVQGQRDRFGAHGFRRTDRAGDFHGPWVQPDEEATK